MGIDFLLIDKAITVTINIVAIWLSIWVYSSNSKQKLNKAFIGLVLFMLLWIDFSYLARIEGESDPFLALMILRAAWFAMPLFFVHLYILVLYLVDEDYKRKPLDRLVVISGLIAAFTAGATNLVISDIEFLGVSLVRIIYGVGMMLFLAIVLFIIFVTLYHLVRGYFAALAKLGGKVEYFFLGIIAFYLANIVFNIVFPFLGITRYYFLGYYSSVFLLIFIAYTIVKKELFSLKIVVTVILVSLIAIILALDLFIFTPSVTLQFFKAIGLIFFLFLSRDLIRSVLQEARRVKHAERLARDLAQANASLKELIDMKNNFLHIVSHQLRTPLTAMRGFVSMWQEGDFDSYTPRKMAEIKKRIANNAERLNNLVNDMVVAMESEGGMKLSFIPVDVEDLIKTNIEFMKSNYEKKKLYLRYRKTEKTLPKIEADPKYLGNAFMNLIDNAEKYTLKGGLKIQVGTEGDKVKIIFADTGVGVKPKDKKLLFKKFSRGSESSSINPNGSGLGLYIIKQIIKTHHGRIELISEGENKGTTFIVTLPVKQPILVNSKASGTTPVNPSLGGIASPGPGVPVLAPDKNPLKAQKESGITQPYSQAKKEALAAKKPEALK